MFKCYPFGLLAAYKSSSCEELDLHVVFVVLRKCSYSGSSPWEIIDDVRASNEEVPPN